MLYQIFLSDKAYQGLIAQAREKDFVRGFNRPKGLGLYMSGVLRLNPTIDTWKDTRPASLQAMTLNDLEAGQFTQWDDGELRAVRLLTIPQPHNDNIEAINIVRELGFQLGVLKLAPHKLKKATMFSQFWEAIGLGWLTPMKLPEPKYVREFRAKKEDIEW